MTDKKPLVIKRQTVTSSVTDELRRRIISGEYVGGEQIRQEAVGSELGVSRIPVREALLQLESEGLVVIHTHKGATVVSLTEEGAADLFEARLMIEPAIMKQAIQAATPDDISKVRTSLIEYEKAVEADSDPGTLSKLNWAFHVAMCEPAKRPRLLGILRSLYTATDHYLWLQINSPEARARAMEDHRMLFHAYSTKKADVAQEQIVAHINGAYQDVLGRLKAQRRPR